MTALPNVVLVHGAWADGSSWSAVIERLQAEGYSVTAPQFPMNALADNVARLRLVLGRQDGPTIVAGHSYGRRRRSRPGRREHMRRLVARAAHLDAHGFSAVRFAEEGGLIGALLDRALDQLCDGAPGDIESWVYLPPRKLCQTTDYRRPRCRAMTARSRRRSAGGRGAGARIREGPATDVMGVLAEAELVVAQMARRPGAASLEKSLRRRLIPVRRPEGCSQHPDRRERHATTSRGATRTSVDRARPPADAEAQERSDSTGPAPTRTLIGGPDVDVHGITSIGAG